MIAPAAIQIRSFPIAYAGEARRRLTGTMSREDHIRDLGTARRARVANTDHHLGVVVVSETAAAAGDDRPSLANDLGTGRDHDSVGNNIDTGVEEDDLAARKLHYTLMSIAAYRIV